MAKLTETDKRVNAKRYFVEGYLNEDGKRIYPSVAECGRNNEIPRASVYRIAKEDGWQEARSRFLSEVEKKHSERMAEDVADERGLLDKRCMQLANAALAEVAIIFSQAQSERADNTKYRLPEQLIESATRSLGNAQKIGKLALGDAQEIQKVTTDVSVSDAFEELVREVEELGRQKASFGNHSIN
jgi:hypothetical protein